MYLHSFKELGNEEFYSFSCPPYEKYLDEFEICFQKLESIVKSSMKGMWKLTKSEEKKDYIIENVYSFSNCWLSKLRYGYHANIVKRFLYFDDELLEAKIFVNNTHSLNIKNEILALPYVTETYFYEKFKKKEFFLANLLN